MEPRYIVCWLSVYFELSSSFLFQVALVDHVVRIRYAAPSRYGRVGVLSGNHNNLYQSMQIVSQ